MARPQKENRVSGKSLSNYNDLDDDLPGNPLSLGKQD